MLVLADPNNALIASHRIVMMFICKAGNTSVKRALADALDLPPNDAVPEQLQPHRRFDLAFPTPNKMDAHALRAAGWLVCGIVRHPLARIASCYEDKICGGTLFGPFARKYGGTIRANMPFADFVDAVCAIPDGQADQHFRSMSWDMATDAGEIVPEHIFRVEDNEWWQDLRRTILNHCEVNIGGERRENASRMKNWRGYYSPKSLAAAKLRFARDLRLFGYDA